MKKLLILIITLACIGCTNTQPQEQDTYYIEQQQMLEDLRNEFMEYVDEIEQDFNDKKPTSITYAYFKNRNVHSIHITDTEYLEDIKTPTSTINIIGINDTITTTIVNAQGVRTNTTPMPPNFIENKIAQYNQQQQYNGGK